MKRTMILTIAIVALIATAVADTAQAGEGSLLGYYARFRAKRQAWNGDYYSAAWGMPVALVVPPTAERQVDWGWGVGNTRVTPIYHQFHRNYPGPGEYSRSMYSPTPAWPSDTRQFGVYYVRGPW
ncbi:MAG: hypothetical protein JW888_01255 [Pirellulales bacterium]|nr:hypothetical protein [Pirellulales bacterium]